MFDNLSWSELVISGMVVLFMWCVAIDAVIKFVA
jgi:hypothetical protein